MKKELNQYDSINESKNKKAVIIKGNPKRVHPDGDLYERLQEFLVEKGFEVVMDDGKPHTVPDESADIWIGHSRGADRLRFAPNGIKAIAIGSNLEGSVNHPDDFDDFENPDDFDDLPDEVKKPTAVGTLILVLNWVIYWYS